MDIEARLKQINANSHYGLYPRRHSMEVKKMTFEESKEILKKSIDTSDTINQVIENFIQSIYAKGYDDALNNMLAPETIEEDKKSTEEEPNKGEWLRMSDLSELEDDRYKCSCCGNVVHHKYKTYLYTFNSWCGRCGSNNYPYPQESEENGKLMSKEEKNERKEV